MSVVQASTCIFDEDAYLLGHPSCGIVDHNENDDPSLQIVVNPPLLSSDFRSMKSTTIPNRDRITEPMKIWACLLFLQAYLLTEVQFIP